MPTYPQTQHDRPEEFKASYDDLIDEYAAPYSATSHHQTFSIGNGSQHRRVPSYPKQKTFSSKLSDETHETHETASSAYPPLPITKEIDPRTFWQKVYFRFLLFLCCWFNGDPDSTRIFGLSSLCSHRSYWDNDRSSDRGRIIYQTTRKAVGWWFECCWRYCSSTDAGVLEHLCTSPVSSFCQDACSVLIFLSVFQFAMAVDAVYARNTLQFILLT